ncbi:queuosine precursor transporter [Holosporaceae bacterium 'Namur']|nr:queuosine precursor transporter [Holosporaceae bacterium 'Namur']
MDIREKTYVSLCAIFSVLVTTGNLIYQKFVYLPLLSFHTFELSVGAIIYPFTFMVADIIAEFYGAEKAKFCVRLSVIMNIMVAFIVIIATRLEATVWSKVSNSEFVHIFGSFNVAFISSIIASYVAQSLDVVLYMRIKKLSRGKFLLLRSNLSTAISLLVDTTLVISLLAIFDILPKEQALILIVNSYMYKLFFTLCGNPLFYFLVKGAKFIGINPARFF